MALFGRYEYAGELGRGATGRVFAARDRASADALRALKVVSESDAARLVWEFARLSQLEHPRVARVRELLRIEDPSPAPFSLTRGSLVLVEDLAAGEPVSRLIERESADPAHKLQRALAVAVDIAEGLAVIHEAGLVHGDVKPDNVLWESSAGATLIDLGLATVPSAVAAPRGTPRFMAPECFAGICTPAADVYALGALLFDWLSGELSEPAPTGRLVPWRERPMGILERVVPSDVARVLGELLRADPARRVPNGRTALGILLGLMQRLGLPVDPARLSFASAAESMTPVQRAQRARALPFEGHAELVQTLSESLERPGLCWLTAPRGAGASRALREALRILQARRAGRSQRVPTWVTSLASLDALRDVDAVLHLERPTEATVSQARRAVEAFALRGDGLCVVIEGSVRPLACPGESELALGALSDADFENLFQSLLSPQRADTSVVKAARQATDGLAGRLCECLARLLGEGRDGTDARVYEAGGAGHAEEEWSPGARRVATWLAWTQGKLLDRAFVANELGERETGLAFDELVARGALSAAGLGLRSELARRVRRETRDAGLKWLREVPRASLSDPGAYWWLAQGEQRAAVDVFSREAGSAARAGYVDAAAELLQESLGYLEPGEGDEPLRLQLADLERTRARYQEGLAVLSGLISEPAWFARGELLRLAGSPVDASAALDHCTHGVWAARAAALRARIRFDSGDVAGAHRVLATVPQVSDGLAATRALEVRVLITLAEGQPERAPIEAMVTRALALGAPRWVGRALALRAHVRVLGGDRVRAIADLREAVARARAAGEVHEAATYAVNLALCELEDGALGPALETLRDAAYRLAWIGRPADLARVLFNLGNAALLIGDDTRAELVLAEAVTRADQVGDVTVRASVGVAESELALRRGGLDASARKLESLLLSVPRERVALWAVIAARVGQAQLLLGNLERAEHMRGELEQLVPLQDVRARLEADTFFVRLASAHAAHEQACALGEAALQQAGPTLPFAEHVRLLLAAADAARACGKELRLLEWTATCRALLEGALASLPPALRANMREQPSFARVLSAQAAPSADQHAGLSRWRDLVRASRRLFSEKKAARIAQRAVEIALDLVHAERALVIVERENGPTEVLAHADLRGLSGPAPAFSRSVVHRVWLDAAPVMSVEAAHDARFDNAQSVHSLSVRSIMAVPLEGFEGRAVLYLDDRLRAAAFGADDQNLLLDLAELTRQSLRAGQGIVLERKRARSAEQETLRLSRQLEHLASISATASLPGPFVGVSAVMTRLTDLARRVASSDVPVLVTGESGTGKELVARFVHAESARRGASFVAENCAALPDTLLESAMFGHVRGAFTGAERARRGLFEVADGGTLLLDEVAEMSPALQGKLLRVLQEGEFRPLGSERVRRVNVRVIAATHRDLLGLVREGRFREDLYYRLAVVTLEVPSLSERVEDIPLLVQHFVQRHAGDRSVRVSREAMSLFQAKAYPGNVRQLENEVRRALALCDEDIRPEHVQSEPTRRPGLEPAALDLHEQTELLTRRLVELAMAQAGGNVSQAAQLLGVSRFGLQKILKRLATTRS